MCKGITPKQFLSTHQEWHAFAEGIFDGFFPFIKGSMSKELKESLEGEHHYYRFGVVLGVIGFVWFWIGIWKFVT